MKPTVTIFALVGWCALSPQTGFADCLGANNTAEEQQASRISKDGTHAPMENKGKAQAQPGPAVGTTTSSSTTSAQAQKDGTNMPMGENPDVATSSQDAEAQQKGDKTAAATAQDKKC